jgi:porin
MKNTGTLLSILISAALAFPLHVEGDEGKVAPAVEFTASLTGDMARSIAGGLKQGTAWLGMASLNATLNTGQTGLWKNGTVTVTGAHTLGSMPSSELFGDAQVSSNIEAGNHTFLMELWIRQQFGRVVITAGLQDLNAIFALSESGGLYLNSSFGIMPVISCNIPAPIFPLTSPGLTVVLETGRAGSVALALFDGRPIPFDSNPYNIRWKFDREDGLLAIMEYSHKIVINGLEGEYKIGLFSHNHLFDSFRKNESPTDEHSPTLGGYIIADQPLMHRNNRQVALFMQAGYSPSVDSFMDLSAGLGINVSGLIRGREDDMAGVAVTAGRFSGNAGAETTIEVTYRLHFGDYAYLQPDLQYIIFPSGSLSGIPHCIAGFMRLGVSF